jgi:predicted transcriptional regulator of viral defense system
MTNKQKSVINYLNTVESAIVVDIHNNAGFNYGESDNPGNQMTAFLSRMVKQGYINRVKKGHYAINHNYKKAQRINETISINQIPLIEANNEISNCK